MQPTHVVERALDALSRAAFDDVLALVDRPQLETVRAVRVSVAQILHGERDLVARGYGFDTFDALAGADAREVARRGLAAVWEVVVDHEYAVVSQRIAGDAAAVRCRVTPRGDPARRAPRGYGWSRLVALDYASGTWQLRPLALSHELLGLFTNVLITDRFG